MPTEQAPMNVHSSIDQFMTRHPHTIGRDRPLSAAHEVMRTLRIRHLPVLEGGRLVGVLSQRDLYFTETLRDVDADTVTVDEAMSSDVYTVPPDCSLGAVASAMLAQRFGCAVVVRDDQVVGIFTTTDALRVLVGIIEA
jgi:acetoin utilization protein AcuB